MKLLYTLMALSLPLMGLTCQEQLRSTLTQTCDGLDVAYAHYDAVAATGAIPAANMNKVAIARRQTDRICASPGAATTVSITAAAASAYIALNGAFRHGGNSTEARLGYSQLKHLKQIADEARRP